MDRRLRELERQAAQSPQAGAAYAQALARSGQRREAFLLWCRLAREGLDSASRALRSWPRLRSTSCAILAAPPADPKGAGATSARDRVIPLPGAGVCFEATESTLYVRATPAHASLRQRVRTVAIDLISGRQGWVSEEGELPLGCVGDDLVTRKGNVLVLRDHRDGSALAEMGVSEGTSALSLDRDRLVTVEGDRTRGHDLGRQFGKLLWDRATGTDRLRRPQLLVNGEWFYAYRGLTLEVSEVETGLTRWREERCFLLPSTLGKRYGSFVTRGDSGLWVRSASSDTDDGTSSVNWIGADQRLGLFTHGDGPSDGGAMAAGFPQGHLSLITQSATQVFYVRMIDRSLQLTGVDRSALAPFAAQDPMASLEAAQCQAPSWTRSVERIQDLLAQGERVLLLAFEAEGLVVRVLDAATGRQRYRVRVKTPAVAHWPVSGRLIPVGGDQLLVAVCSQHELHLIRIGLRG